VFHWQKARKHCPAHRRKAVPFSYQQSSLRLSFCAWSSRWIPPPSVEPAESYSGKWQLRAPKSLHRRLAECAKREGVSLNILAFTLLDRLGGVEDRGGRPVGAGDPGVVESGPPITRARALDDIACDTAP